MKLRTPLTSLQLAIGLCEEQVAGPLTAQQSKLLADARQDCDRLRAMLSDLLDLARLESGLSNVISNALRSRVREVLSAAWLGAGRSRAWPVDRA
jgi:signal transduction histidine kinase